MTSRFLWIAAGSLFLSTAALAQDAASVIAHAQATLGNPASLQFTGTGTNGFFGQALTAGETWPQRQVDAVSAAINYDQKAANLDLTFHEPVFGGQHQVTFVNGDRAWTTVPFGPTPQLPAAEERQLQIWMSPHGFLRAAAASHPTIASRTENGAKVDVVSFIALDKFKVTGTIDAAGEVTAVETLFPNPVLGDMTYSYKYEDYKDFDGIKFPTHIVQSEGGFPVNDFTVRAVKANADAIDLSVPSRIQAAAMPGVKVESQQIGDGVWFVGGGSHHSVVVAFKNFIAVIEGPLNEDRSNAVIAEAKRLAPGKPIKYVVNTHHHFDHAGGLRTYVAEGAIVVTHASNKAYFEKAFMAPAALAPDAEAKAHKKPKIEAVRDKFVISDGKKSIEVYNTIGDSHSTELMVAYIPSAKVLVEADSYSPLPAGVAPPKTVPPDALVLYDNIERLKLSPETIVGIHGAGPAPMAEFLTYIGKRPG